MNTLAKAAGLKKNKFAEMKAKIAKKATSEAKKTADPAASSSAAADLSASSGGPADPMAGLAADGCFVCNLCFLVWVQQ